MSLPFSEIFVFIYLISKENLTFRWGTTDRTVGDSSSSITNNTGPYVRRRPGAVVNDSTSSAVPSTLVSVTTSLPSVTSTPATNVTVTSTKSIG